MGDDKEEVKLGDFVELSGHRMGQIKYVGEIHGKKGTFYGVELWKGDGKHSGVYEGIEYFDCVNDEMGIFVVPKAILYILDVPSNYDPFARVKQRKALLEKKKKERAAKYAHLDKKNLKNKNKNKNKKKYKSNNKQSQKPPKPLNNKNKSKLKSKPKTLKSINSTKSRKSAKSGKPAKSAKKTKSKPKTKAKAKPKPKNNKPKPKPNGKANGKPAALYNQQSIKSPYANAHKPNHFEYKNNDNTSTISSMSSKYRLRDQSTSVMSVSEFKSISLKTCLGKGDNFDIAKRICKFFDDLFSDTDTVCLVSNIDSEPKYSLNIETTYKRINNYTKEGKYVLVYRSNPHIDTLVKVSKALFKSVVKGISIDNIETNDILNNLNKLFGTGCNVVRSKKISFDIYSRFSDGYECELRLPNGGDYVLAWRR